MWQKQSNEKQKTGTITHFTLHTSLNKMIKVEVRSWFSLGHNITKNKNDRLDDI